MPAEKIKLISIADTPAAQEQGLQHVREMAANSGMLFKFKHPRVLSFWMKNTYVPLDIAFIDQEGLIVKTEQMIPMSLRAVSSGVPCALALEVPAGTLARLKAVPGSKANINFEEGSVTFSSLNKGNE